MNCPNCKTAELKPTTLETALPGYVCGQCQGNWIASGDYGRWRERRVPRPSEQRHEELEIAVMDTERIKFCPECRRMMLRYLVGRGTGIGLDQCTGCNGMWFDGGEWELLRQRNLHDEVHSVFTAAWQDAVRREELRSRLDAIHRERFGSDYEEIKRLRAWIETHPERVRIIAFLTDPDPYRP